MQRLQSRCVATQLKTATNVLSSDAADCVSMLIMSVLMCKAEGIHTNRNHLQGTLYCFVKDQCEQHLVMPISAVQHLRITTNSTS